MTFLKRSVLKCLIFLWGLCSFFSVANAQEKMPVYAHEIAQHFMESISIFSNSSYEVSSGIPMRIAIQKGALDLVGDVKLKLSIGVCLSEKDKKLLSKLLDKKLAQRYPNCKLYKLGHTCTRSLSEVRTICALRTNKTMRCPSTNGISEIALELKCPLPLRSSNVFFTDHKVYR